MYRSRIFGVLFAFATAIVPASAGEPCCQDKKPTDKKSGINVNFEKLKEMVGEWEITSPTDRAQKGKVHARYHLTSGATQSWRLSFPGKTWKWSPFTIATSTSSCSRIIAM